MPPSCKAVGLIYSLAIGRSEGMSVIVERFGATSGGHDAQRPKNQPHPTSRHSPTPQPRGNHKIFLHEGLQLHYHHPSTRGGRAGTWAVGQTCFVDLPSPSRSSCPTREHHAPKSIMLRHTRSTKPLRLHNDKTKKSHNGPATSFAFPTGSML